MSNSKLLSGIRVLGKAPITLKEKASWTAPLGIAEDKCVLPVAF